jgi:outer membrane receptor protein involved in Fe transport
MRLISAVLLCCLMVRAVLPAELSERMVDFDIRAQPLSSALFQFAIQSGIQWSAETRLVDRNVRAVRGRMTASTALRRLLADTGLSFTRVNANTIALVPGNERTAARETTSSASRPDGAQSTPASDPVAAAEAIEEIAEVQITGTRIQVPGNYTAGNPVTSITWEEMRRLGLVNVGDVITTLVPQDISTYIPTLTNDFQTYTGNDTGVVGGPGTGNQIFDRGSFFVGYTIANLRGLDPMFGTRTLTLIDGRRVVSTSNQADVIDLNIIPSNLLQRMDVVTGGASATYGSGAMAGVVNLVLNNRLTGFNLDLDYGFNESGDGGSPHVSASAGTPLFGGRGHALIGVEWQDQHAIRDCAEARAWCAESRALFNNFATSTAVQPGGPATPDVNEAFVPLPGFESLPARLRVSGLRYNQFAPTGSIYSNSLGNSSGFRFTPDGTGIEEFPFGYRGGSAIATALNGDGPLVTTGLALRPSTERSTVFTNFEFGLSNRLTGFAQASYAKIDSLSRNSHTIGTACLRFNSTGAAAIPGGSAAAGTDIAYGGNGEAFTDPFNGGAPVPDFPRNPLWSIANFRAFLGVPNGRVPPYFIPPGQSGSTNTTPPTWTFTNATNPVWQRITSAQGTAYWNLVKVTLTTDFNDPGTPAVLPQLGRNANAFLYNLSPEALYQVQRAFNNSPTAAGGTGALTALYGGSPCSGFTAIRKVWTPQIQQWTTQESETWRVVAGIKGSFGLDWRWEAYYQHGRTDSSSRQNNVQTNLSFAFAMDSVIDDRRLIEGEENPDYLKPVCRIRRDGVPVIDATGRPMSDPEGLAALAAGCKPLNIFGTVFNDPAAAQLQREALDYAFKGNISDGANSLQTLAFNTSGTLWRGRAGPLTGAFGLELREDQVDNQGSRGPFYLRADIARAWGDAFGGRTRVAEGYTELDMPLVSGLPGLQLWSVNVGARYASYNNKGGSGTTGQAATQGTMNWKFQTVVEPFDWVRLRLTRSRDLRAAGYRELFLNQPAVPDQASDINPWRQRTAESTENQFERWGFVRSGNAELKPEKSDTLTFGVVLSPAGWADGMRMSVDYYDIRVRDAIYMPFDFENPIRSCWENSGNIEAQYIDGGIDPANPGRNGLINDDLPECREITFAVDEDGSRDLEDIVAYNASRPVNSFPYRRRGIDFALNYLLPVERALENVPGALSLTMRATRALESSGMQQRCGSFTTVNNTTQCLDSFSPVDQVGQVRSSIYIPGVAATPSWTGNFIASYLHGDLVTSLSARYVGGARLDKTWTDDPTSSAYRNANGQVLYGAVDNNRVKPYWNFSLNGSWDLPVADLRQFQLFGSVNNLLDKPPPFTGGGISGASAQYHDTMGRAYRLGVRMRF